MREEYVLWVTFTRSKEDNDKHAPNETQHHEKNMDDARFSTRARAPVLIPSLRYPSVPRRISGVRFRALATAAAVLQAGLSVESACWCQSSSPNRDCWDMNFTTRQSGISTLCLIVSRHNRLRESSAPCPDFPSRLGAAREQFFPSRALLSIALCTQCTTILHRTIAP